MPVDVACISSKICRFKGLKPKGEATQSVKTVLINVQVGIAAKPLGERERDNDWKDPSLDECLESFGWMMMDAFGSSIKAHKGHHQLEDPSLHGFGSPWWVEQTPNQPPEKSSEERTNS